MRRLGVWLLGVLVLVACTGADAPAGLSTAAAPAVASEFAAFYDDYGALRTFGYPLTGAFVVPDSGRMVQYFQNLRLELNPGNGRIEVTPLGVWALTEVGRDEGEEGAVAPAFQDFYDQFDGETLFGPAFSPQLAEGGRWVQYFRNARLEWHPEEPPDLRVQVAQLGQVHYLRSGAVYTYYQQRRGQDFIPDNLAGLQEVDLAASVHYPILFAGDEQQIAVAVRTPDGYAVPDVAVRVTLYYEDGGTQEVLMPATDRSGRTEGTLPLDVFTPGYVVRARVTTESSTGRVLGAQELRFKMWW